MKLCCKVMIQELERVQELIPTMFHPLLKPHLNKVCFNVCYQNLNIWFSVYLTESVFKYFLDLYFIFLWEFF